MNHTIWEVHFKDSGSQHDDSMSKGTKPKVA